MSAGTGAQLAYLLVLLAAVGTWVVIEYRGRMGQALRSAAAWALIFVGVMAGYGIWDDMQTPLRQQAVLTSDGVQIPRAPDGHFHLTLQINGTPVEFLVDTGATNMVLSQAAARRLGIEPSSLAFIGQANTANGIVRTARVRLPEVTLGPWTDRSVPVAVTDGDMTMSLLGMDYLSRYHVEMAGNRMVLRR